MKWDFAEITNTAQTGDATKATAKKGEMMTDVLVKCVAETIRELDAMDWNYCSKQHAASLD